MRRPPFSSSISTIWIFSRDLEDLAVDAAAGINVLGGARATVLGAAVNLAEAADTDGLAEVDVAGDAGGADVALGGGS